MLKRMIRMNKKGVCFSVFLLLLPSLASAHQSFNVPDLILFGIFAFVLLVVLLLGIINLLSKIGSDSDDNDSQ